MSNISALENWWRPLQDCDLSLFSKQKQWGCGNMRGNLVQLILLRIFIYHPSRMQSANGPEGEWND